MKKITRFEFSQNKEFYQNEIKKGKIFIYPTDTIYGIGCIATNDKAVSKIRTIKQRDATPFSIIAPSKDWIKENCKITGENFLEKLPGKYTLIFELKNKSAISKKVNNNLNTLGIRIPNHWFSKFLFEINKTFVTTSANISGKPAIKSIQELDDSIKNQVNYIIDEGILNNPPSKIINTITGEILR